MFRLFGKINILFVWRKLLEIGLSTFILNLVWMYCLEGSAGKILS